VDNKRQIGMRVRAYRLERHLTQEQLAERLERSVETISNLERGKSLPSEATLRRLARCLDVSLQDLLIDRNTDNTKGRPIEFYQSAELLKMMDQRKLKLAYAILKAIADS
jgi:transcriptional regulator with XRE-family HTH domain